MPWRARAGWAARLAVLCVIGFLTTEGGITDRFLRPAQLRGVVFVETPPGWLPRDEAEQAFRGDWCADQGIPPLACGPGPLARDEAGDRAEEPAFLPQQRAQWCRSVIDDADPETGCAAFFAEHDARYRRDWRRARENAIDALPKRDLSGADLRGAVLMGARMEGAYLREARMEGADLSYARMEGANLLGTRIEGATFFGARMEGAYLSEARMEGADLRGARMEGADITLAQMEGADLRASSLQWAAVRHVDVSSVDSIWEFQMTTAFGDATVELPDGMDRPDHWPDWDLPFYGDHGFDTEWREWQANPEGYTPPPKPEG